jgi:anti-anti-sigma regulatory factor
MATAAQEFSTALYEIPSRISNGHAKELRSRVRSALESGERRFVVDCHAWESLDLNMLSTLIQCAAECRLHGATLEVESLSSVLEADVRALHLHERLGLHA